MSSSDEEVVRMADPANRSREELAQIAGRLDPLCQTVMRYLVEILGLPHSDAFPVLLFCASSYIGVHEQGEDLNACAVRTPRDCAMGKELARTLIELGPCVTASALMTLALMVPKVTEIGSALREADTIAKGGST